MGDIVLGSGITTFGSNNLSTISLAGSAGSTVYGGTVPISTGAAVYTTASSIMSTAAA